MPEDGLLGEGLQENSSGGAFFSKDKVSFGAMGDSTYEYMIKLWIQSGRKEQKFRDMWDKSMNGVHNQLVQKSSPNGLTYLADRENGRLHHKMVTAYSLFSLLLTIIFAFTTFPDSSVSSLYSGSSSMLHGWCTGHRGLYGSNGTGLYQSTERFKNRKSSNLHMLSNVRPVCDGYFS